MAENTAVQFPAGMKSTVTTEMVKSVFNVAEISGRVFQSRRVRGDSGSYFLTIITLPAPDEFSSPQNVEVVSGFQLGTKGDDCRVKVKIEGYRRSYQRLDKETGEQVSVVTADNRLRAME